MTSDLDQTITINGTRYSRVFRDTEGRAMVTVREPNGDTYATYGVSEAVVAAWRHHDLSLSSATMNATRSPNRKGSSCPQTPH